MIFEELKCKKEKQTVIDAQVLVRYAAKQSDDISQLVDYATSHSKNDEGTSQFICANEIAYVPLNAEGDAKLLNWGQVIEELQNSYRLNSNTKQPFRHFVLSLSQGEHLNQRQWRKGINKLMSHLGYNNARYIAFKHTDTDNEHVHIVASTTDILTGKIISNWQSHLKAQDVMRELETELSLQGVVSSKELHSDYQKDMRYDTKQTIKRMMRRRIDTAIRSLPKNVSLSQYEIALLKQGIEIELTKNNTGNKYKGIAYRFNDFRLVGSALKSGNKYTLGKLIGNTVLCRDAALVSQYEHYNDVKRIAVSQFIKIRRASLTMADELKKELEDFHQQRFRYLQFVFGLQFERELLNEADFWLNEKKRIRDSRDKMIVQAIYDCEKGIYAAANTMHSFFFHVLLTLIELSLHQNWKLEIQLLNETALINAPIPKQGHANSPTIDD